MARTSNLYQIEQVVTRALHYADVGEDQYRRFLQLAFDGWRELNRGVVRGRETWVKVTPDAINRIDYPQDMEEFIGIGIPRGGKIWLLTEKDDIIATLTDDGVGNLSLDSDDGEGVDTTTAQYENIKSTGGVNIHGYYTIDHDRQEIIVNSTSRDELILVYTTSGINTDQITYIPTKAADALIAYILWRDASGRMKSSGDIPIVQARKIEWQEEKMKLKKREMFSIPEFRDVLNSTSSLLRR
jgi:hypothetical protein